MGGGGGWEAKDELNQPFKKKLQCCAFSCDMRI